MSEGGRRRGTSVVRRDHWEVTWRGREGRGVVHAGRVCEVHRAWVSRNDRRWRETLGERWLETLDERWLETMDEGRRLVDRLDRACVVVLGVVGLEGEHVA